jgi:hypothetical protein
MSVPPNLFVDHGACPFECCTYRDWTTNKPVELFDKPKGKRIGSIVSGTPVAGITGDVISHPVRLRATRDYEETSVKKGDVFYALHYSGEGFWAVWHKGKVQQAEFFGDELKKRGSDPSEIFKDTSEWWVKVKMKDGKIGWAISDGNFDNQDACG